MSIHRSQTLLLRPQTLKLGLRNAASITTKKMHTQALALRAPSRPAIMSHRPATIAISGAALAAAFAALAREAALSQAVLFNRVSGPSGTDSNNSSSNRDDKRKDPIDRNDKDLLTRLLDNVTNRMGDISLGTGLGFCSGYALKQAGKAAALTIGAVFLLAQVASKKGYININWNKVESDVIKAVDPDGDGKLTKRDLQVFLERLVLTLKYNVPSSAGFTGGFVLALMVG